MRLAVDVFSEWADIGKDEGMARGHTPAVQEILNAAFDEMSPESIERGFSAIDAGCGNGWVVRSLKNNPSCSLAMGVDGAKSMIVRALEKDPEGLYFHADLMSWSPPEKVDIVHSMEVLYYLDNIPDFLENVRSKWLVKGGIFAFGVDHYLENKESLEWPEKVGVRMTTLSESEWVSLVNSSGLDVLKIFKANKNEEWPGTLVIVSRS